MEPPILGRARAHKRPISGHVQVFETCKSQDASEKIYNLFTGILQHKLGPRNMCRTEKLPKNSETPFGDQSEQQHRCSERCAAFSRARQPAPRRAPARSVDLRRSQRQGLGATAYSAIQLSLRARTPFAAASCTASQQQGSHHLSRPDSTARVGGAVQRRGEGPSALGVAHAGACTLHESSCARGTR